MPIHAHAINICLNKSEDILKTIKLNCRLFSNMKQFHFCEFCLNIFPKNTFDLKAINIEVKQWKKQLENDFHFHLKTE